jgi:hypothetical protein
MGMLNRLERAEALDRMVSPVQKAARSLGPRSVRDALHGVWLGHPVHPVLAQAAVGAWLSAGALDLWPDADEAARRLTVIGLLASGPAVLAGTVDWAEQHEQQMRVGVVHAQVDRLADLVL